MHHHILSYVPIYITLMYEKEPIATATAFFYTYEGRDYFITNWHNVTGREPADHSPKSKDAAIPDNLKIQVPFHEFSDNLTIQLPFHEQAAVFKWVPIDLPLYSDADRLKPLWWEHPIYGSNVDVVVMELGGRLNEQIGSLSETRSVAANAESLGLNLLQVGSSQFRLVPGMDVFVLGFPRGLSGGEYFPIWKRGSIASEPDINIDNLPKLYIDTATREGMSGSPVYAQESSFWVPEGKSVAEGFFGKGNRFLGIYSGRIGNDSFLAQLGIVWKEEAIQSIINSKKIGISSFELIKKDIS
jgi:Trypsin-like peptidase domain